MKKLQLKNGENFVISLKITMMQVPFIVMYDIYDDEIDVCEIYAEVSNQDVSCLASESMINEIAGLVREKLEKQYEQDEIEGQLW